MNENTAEHAAKVLKAIAHPVRLQIVELLQAGEMCVGDIVEALGGKQAITSQQLRTGKEIRFRFWLQRGQGWQGSKTQAYWLVVRVLLTPPAEAADSQKWKIIYLQVLNMMKTKGVLSCRRDGAKVYYRIENRNVINLLRCIYDH